jgi:predicted glycosyltransferase
MAKVLFYVQSLWGVGHLSRASAIASACVEAGLDVTLVNGGPPVPGLVEDKVRLVQLPPVRSADESYSKLVTISGADVDDAFRETRRAQLLQTLSGKPDVVITETWPFGRRKLAFELEPFIVQARSSTPRPLVLSSVRDILVPPKIVERAEAAVVRAKRDFDAVLVHGDEKIITLGDSFPLATQLADLLRYTGYVLRKPATKQAKAEERFDIVVSAGGGRSGAALINAALAASRSIDQKLKWLVITGPQIGPSGEHDLPANVTISAHRPDLSRLLATAKVSISQAGYNTALEAVTSGCRAVLVPFMREGEMEQFQRAERFAKLGFARLLNPERLDDLGDVVRAELQSHSEWKLPGLRADGAEQTAQIIGDMIEGRRR